MLISRIECKDVLMYRIECKDMLTSRIELKTHTHTHGFKLRALICSSRKHMSEKHLKKRAYRVTYRDPWVLQVGRSDEKRILCDDVT